MNSDKTRKISADQMWFVIEEMLSPCDSVPDKAKISEEQIVKLYNIVKEADELFRMLQQIIELKKEIDRLTKK